MRAEPPRTSGQAWRVLCPARVRPPCDQSLLFPDGAHLLSQDLLVGAEVSTRQAGSVRVTEMASCSGDATIAVVRGKPRHGYDFEIKLNWKAEARRPSGAIGKGGCGVSAAPQRQPPMRFVVLRARTLLRRLQVPSAGTVKGTVTIPEASRDTVTDDGETCVFLAGPLPVAAIRSRGFFA